MGGLAQKLDDDLAFELETEGEHDAVVPARA